MKAMKVRESCPCAWLRIASCRPMGEVGYSSFYLPTYLPMALQPSVGLASFSVSWSFYRGGRTPWMGDQSVAGPLPEHRTAQTQNKSTQTSIPEAGFEPTFPVFERAKTVHALYLYLVATVMSRMSGQLHTLDRFMPGKGAHGTNLIKHQMMSIRGGGSLVWRKCNLGRQSP
jgi:hypothetical protein